MQIPHFGSVSGLNADWRQLPPAKLSLDLSVDGKQYHCTEGGKWTRFSGPRLIESGRFLQRGDVTDLLFQTSEGEKLAVETRFETVAWPNYLGFNFSARPSLGPIPPGESAFGRIGGGFGLDGTNCFEVPHSPELDPEQFTLEFWAFVPADYQPTEKAPTYLLSLNSNEHAEGNVSVIVVRESIRVHMNIGGGPSNLATLTNGKQPLNLENWNHFAITYDGETLKFYLNGQLAGETQVGRKRVAGQGGLAFGRRQDNAGDGSHFRGIVDEIGIYDRSLTLEELRLRWRRPETDAPNLKPISRWSFDPNGPSSMTRPRRDWKQAAMGIRFTTPNGELQKRFEVPPQQRGAEHAWHTVSLAIDPITLGPIETPSVKVSASEFVSGKDCSVQYQPLLGAFQVSLDQSEILPPPSGKNPSNDAIERFKLALGNPTNQEQIARVIFEKKTQGMRLQKIGTPITGISAVLRDSNGHPTGLPVQLSKNWHTDARSDDLSGNWFHGISQLRIPANTTGELELTICYAHWGGVPAASHAQLCLIGWGSNQLWDQSALGAWGETICYEPDQAQAKCTMTDVRPLMVRSIDAGGPKGNDGQWGWTNNVGGGDFFRVFDSAGSRIPHASMRTTYHRQGPCLTEVTYAGRIGSAITHSITASLGRTDDVPRAVYSLRMDVHAAFDFSRFSFFQASADTYASSREHKMATGNETGLLREWETHWGENANCQPPTEWIGRIPWASIHEARSKEMTNSGAQACRALVLRSWKARLGGKEASPWIAERGVTLAGSPFSNLNLTTPPSLNRLEPGDFLEATLEYVVLPQFAADYYGSNQSLRHALEKDENTWRMAHREALENDRQVQVHHGTLLGLHPAIAIHSPDGYADFTLKGGLGYVPVTFTGLPSSEGRTLLVDNQPLQQTVHGNDFWQTDFDPASKTWSQTFNIPISERSTRSIRLLPPQKY